MPAFTLPPAPAYLVALSGGADSRLLLELTVRALSARPAEGTRVVAAHLHHGIRGEEADRDEAFCRSVCQSLNVPLVVEHADIPAIAERTGESIETAARRVRYDFLVRVMTEQGIPILLTAHHADDHLETLLDRLLRGSGTRGMGGIPPTRVLGARLPDGTPLTVARPLLEWTRSDILAALRQDGLDYVTDSTNLEAEHTRNRLRHTVVPALETIAGEGIPQRAALRLSRAAREDEEALMTLAERAYAAALSGTDGRLPAAAVAEEMPAIAKRMIGLAFRDYWQKDGGVPADCTLSAHHLEALLSLCREGREEAVSDLLGDGVRASIQNGCLTFAPPPDTSAPRTPCPAPRAIGIGVTEWDEGMTVLVEILDTPHAPLSGNTVYASAVFPADLLPLCARPRASGDSILSHGMSKKLKKLLCDKGVPTELRERLPLFLLSDGVTPLWYPGVAFRDGYPAPTSGKCLRITVHLIHDLSSRKVSI